MINDEILQKAKEKFPPYSGNKGARFIDISGQKIGHLQLLYRGENDEKVARPRTKYVCLCDCGNIVSIRAENLQQRKNNNPTCGSCKEYRFSQLKELKNFYILNTYTDENDNGRHHCIIQCKKCGAIFSPRRTELYDNYDKECSKCSCNTFKIGDTIGDLTLISKEVNENNNLYWKCQCSCGKIIFLSGSELHHRRSCGEHNNPEDIIGHQFGKLTVISSTNIIRGGQRIYLCDCQCGTKNIEVGRSNLLTGHTSSCGCLISKGEEIISEILINANISFEKQKTFEDFKRFTHGKFRFDFFVNKEYVIEFDGSQHFNHHKFVGWFTEESFNTTRERDLFKNQYCFSHNIPLIRIPYWEKDNLTISDLIPKTSRFLLTPENEKDYYLN